MAPPAARPIVCAYCQGPLAAELGVVICTYCGKPNNPSGLPGKTAIKEVVREVVREDANGNGVPDMLERPQAAPRQLHVHTKPASKALAAFWVVLIAGGVLFGVGVGVCSIISAPSARHVRASVASAIAKAEKAKPPAPAFGQPKVMQLAGDSIYIATSTHMLRVARGTLAPMWSTPMTGDAQYFLLHDDKVIVSTRPAALIFDAASGAQLARYSFKDSTFGSNSACVANGQVLFDISFEENLLRLDLATGKKTKGDARCKPTNINLRCPTNQTCGRSKYKTDELDCDFELKTDDGRIAACQVDDGSNRSALVAMDARDKPRWTVFSEGKSSRVLFMASAGDFVAVAEARQLTIYDGKRGEMRWQKKTDDYYGAVVVDDANIYTTNADGFIAAFSLATGEQVAAL